MAKRRLHNVEITVNGKSISEPLEIIGLGPEAVYGAPQGTERLGGFHVWRPADFFLRFRLTEDNLVRQLCGTYEEIIKPHSMVIRWLDAAGKPVCTVNLTGVYFLYLKQIKPVQGDPYEEVKIAAEKLTYGGQAAA